MKLSITQYYTQTTLQSSLYRSVPNTDPTGNLSVPNFQDQKQTSFRLDIKLFSRSETNEQSIEYKFLQEKSKTASQAETPAEQSKPKSFMDIFEEGYWGTTQTADRLSNFVISGAGNNVEKMRMGREGIIRGFKEAEKLWGGKLPEISYNTLEKALTKIDERIHSLGQPVIDLAA
nr:hypothetical protein [Desulfobulbaceae bacterium]